MHKLKHLAIAAVGLFALAAASSAQSATTLCVGNGPGCYATIQAALLAAHDNDTIAVAPGTYSGPVTIAKSIQLVGAGAATTIISGGGPVVTIGDLSGLTTPSVSISGVTITGGLTNGTGGNTWVAEGGGVFIPGPDTGNATAATVSISDSVITENRTSPLTVVGPGPPCGPRRCSFASGGGIANAGFLTLTDTRVTDNVAGSTPADPSVATDAGGGGISNHPRATLTLRHSFVSANRAAVSGALAQFASGGGIDGGLMVIENSLVSGNTVDLSTSFPGSIFAGTEPEAEAGGINIGAGGSVTIADSTISGNATTAANTGGDVNADTGGIDSDGMLTLSNSTVENNQARASVPPASGFGALALGGGLEVEIGSTTVNNTSIDGNSVSADSGTGLAAVLGAGLMNEGGGSLTLHNSDVFANNGTATGAFGFADGGGIFNSLGPGQLTVINSTLIENTLTGSPGITPLGGGLFTADVFSLQPLPVTLTHTVIAGNSPDQCFGC